MSICSRENCNISGVQWLQDLGVQDEDALMRLLEDRIFKTFMVSNPEVARRSDIEQKDNELSPNN